MDLSDRESEREEKKRSREREETCLSIKVVVDIEYIESVFHMRPQLPWEWRQVVKCNYSHVQAGICSTAIDRELFLFERESRE